MVVLAKVEPLDDDCDVVTTVFNESLLDTVVLGVPPPLELVPVLALEEEVPSLLGAVLLCESLCCSPSLDFVGMVVVEEESLEPSGFDDESIL